MDIYTTLAQWAGWPAIVALLLLGGGFGFWLLNTRLELQKEINQKLKEELEKLRQAPSPANKPIPTATAPVKEKYAPEFPQPLRISAEKKNKKPIGSAFLSEEACTLLLWFKAPPAGQGLRSDSFNRYLISHVTGAAHERGWPYYNRFSVGHFFDSNLWALTISASAAVERSITLADTLSPGWHQLIVRWDKSLPRLEMSIDGEYADFMTDFVKYWPEKFTEKTMIGSWADQYEGFYCDTELYLLQIYPRYLELNSPEVLAHRSAIKNI